MLYERRDVFYATLVHWNRMEGPVMEFLTHTSLIYRDRDGLSAVAVANHKESSSAAALQRAHDMLWIPGLRRLCMLTSAAVPEGPHVPECRRAIAWSTVNDGGPRALCSAIAGEQPVAGPRFTP